MDESELKNDRRITNSAEDEWKGGPFTNSPININDLIQKITGYVKQRKHKEALEECNKGLGIDPHHEKILEKKIKILCHLGRLNEAHALALHWTERNPKHPVANKELKRLQDVLSALQDQDSDDDTQPNNVKQDENPKTSDVPSTPNNSSSSSTDKTDNLMINGNKSSPANLTFVSDASNTNLNSNDAFPNGFECTFCDIKFKKKNELETHCRSDLHKKRLTSDESQDWHFRPPPRGLSCDEYSLCQRLSENKRCTFGEKCTEAHSEEELKEWKERFKFRREQLQKAREKLLHGNSFTEKLMERLMLSENPSSILVDSLDFVKLHINSDLKVEVVSKKYTNAWTFTVTSKICLHNVGLLDDVNKSYFYISSISVGPKKTQKYQNLETHCQEWSCQDVSMKAHGEFVYRIKVVFKTDIFGTFRQSIVFDFGLDTVLRHEMEVQSVPALDSEKVANDLCISEAARWTKDKVEIVHFEPRIQNFSESEKNLLAKYKLPPTEDFSKPDSTIMQSLSKQNYRQWMHEMLYLEELEELSLIRGFNVKTSLQLVNRFLLMPGSVSTAKYAQNGELYARLKLEDDLSEDSIGGRLILQNAQIAWIAICKSNSEKLPTPKKVYEVLIEDKGKNFVYLRLSKNCVEELKLNHDEEITVQVQFQLNRLPKVEMHLAVDKLPTMDIVFPNLDQLPAIPWSPDRQWNEDLTKKLNVKQKEAILAITSDINIRLPPLMIVGPFGTGKTYTLAKAVQQVLKQDGTRVLICTHSNSAADLYIKDFFHPCVEEGDEDLKPLRILYQFRWVQTVSDVVLKYTLYDSLSATFNFPTLEDLEKHRIVITTLSTARYVSDLDLPEGFFTHIFIDEAAQALECETLIPLSVASESTRLVFAGDHMQLSPTVYSNFCCQQGFHMSLLERLHDLYPPDHVCKIMLCENYRSHSAIVDFTSELFYDNRLVSSGQHKPLGKIYPLTFYAAKGEEVQHPNNTGFYNIAEVYEVVERVEDLHKRWCDDWGPLDEDAISVVTPYADQVKRIRSELRRKKLYRTSVERVHNVQGKQYRVIILSTVRTQSTCRSDSSEENYMDYGFLSNVKLLNTAITRAQSLVMVVGDPVSLCLVGKCRKVWEYFLEICNEHNSLHGMTWAQLRAQLEGVEMTGTYTLNPLAPEFIPRRMMYNITRAASDTAGMPLHNQVPMYPWQYINPYPVAGYNSHLGLPMYPQMVSPYPYPGYMPGMTNPLMYKQFPLSTVSNGGASPKTLQTSSQGPVTRNKSRADLLKTGSKTTEPKTPKMLHKGHMLAYMPQRMPMAYPPYYPVVPHYPGFYYLPDDPRMAYYQHPFMHHAPQHSVLHLPGTEHMFPLPVPGSKMNVKNSKLETESDSSDSRASPSTTNSGQQIQLLPNVKHIPGHLFAGRPRQSKINNLDDQFDHNGDKQQKEERRLHVSHRPYSPANYGCDQRTESPGKDILFLNNNSSQSHQKLKRTEESESSPRSKEGHKSTRLLKTGFSRQFSDDLPTPTEVKDIVQMIEEEQHCSPPNSPPSKNTIKGKKSMKQKRAAAVGTPPPKLQLPVNFSPHVRGETTTTMNEGGKMSYAGVLRKQPAAAAAAASLSSHQNNELGDVDNFTSGLEVQTPRTPSGFITPGAELDMDPFGILKGLNIESAPKQRSFQLFN